MPTSAPAASTTVVDNSAFGGPTAAQAAAANAVIASSSASRAATTGNINTLQTALNNVPPPAGAPGSSTNGGANAQQNTPTGTSLPASTQSNPANNTQTPASTTSTPAFTPPTGATQTTLPNGTTAYYTPANGTTPETMTDASGKPLSYSQAAGGWIDPTTGVAPVAAPATSTDGGSSGSDVNSSAVAGLPTNLQAIAKANLDNLDNQYDQAQAAVTAAAANLANDPALAGAISSIQAQYKVLYDAMGLKNQQVLGRASSEVGAFGGLGVMSQSFLSDEMDSAQTRLSDIIAKEQSAIISAQAAYNKGDVAALNAATSQLKDAQTAKSAAVSELLTATNNAVKTAQAQQKIDQSATNSQITNDIKNAKGVADSLAAKLTASGVTDLSSYDYSDLASQLGISSPEILAAAVEAAGAAATKGTLANANVTSEITDRDSNAANTTTKTNIAVNKANNPTAAKGGGKDGAYTYTSDDISTYTNLLNEGGTGPNGTKYAARGTDGFVDPGAYTAALSDWVSNGGTPVGFAKKFPVVGNVNPASYSALPAAIQPKAAATTSTYTTN